MHSSYWNKIMRINPAPAPCTFPGIGSEIQADPGQGVVTWTPSKRGRRTSLTSKADCNPEQLHSPDCSICHLYKMSRSILLNTMKTQ